MNSLCWKCAAAYPLLTQNYPFLCLETGLVMITIMMVTMTTMMLIIIVILITRGRGREAAVRERGGVIYKSEQVAPEVEFVHAITAGGSVKFLPAV